MFLPEFLSRPAVDCLQKFLQRRQLPQSGSAEVEPNQTHTAERREVRYLVASLETEVRQRQRPQRGQVGDDRPRQVEAKRPVGADVQALVPDAQRIKPTLKTPPVSFPFAISVITVTMEPWRNGLSHPVGEFRLFHVRRG